MKSVRWPKLSREMMASLHKERDNRAKKLDDAAAGRIRGINSDLSPYQPRPEKPWNQRRAAHLMRRINFGLSYEELERTLGSVPQTALTRYLFHAQSASLPEAPPWVNKYPPPRGAGEAAFMRYFDENFELYLEYQTEWTREMRSNPFREKMVLFWHNHFATEINKYQLAPFAYRHFTLLRQHALGNFKELVRRIGLDHAMLIYLDGVESHKDSPNENYARELLELFTTGLGHYTQHDIEEIARAFTGYIVDYYSFEVRLIPFRHDYGEKSIFGRTGDFGYDDVIDLLFEEKARQIAEFVCSKLYRYFVYSEPNPTVVSQMADLFIENDFEIAPVVEALLLSEHFFDEEILGTMIRPPVDMLLGIYEENGVEPNNTLLEAQPYILFNMEQFLFNPPNVAGWPGQRSWINSTTLPFRWDVIEFSLYLQENDYQVDPRGLIQHFSDPRDPYKVAVEMAQFLLAVDLNEEEQARLPDVLLGGIPYYEWDPAIPGARGRLIALMNHIRKLPEYQLM